jgi:hypothetical protein
MEYICRQVFADPPLRAAVSCQSAGGAAIE